MSMEKRSTALVIKSTGSWYVLRDVRSGRPLAGRIRGSLRLRGSRSTNPVVVGDRVEYETADDGTAAIVGVCPRSNYIIRRSPNLSKESHIIAANVDQAFLVVYSLAGYEVLETSAERGDGVEALKARLTGKVSLLSGNSGVGKSSLIRAVDPSLDVRTGEVSASSRRGKHTTTFSEMYLIDTPGIKGFGLIDIADDEVCRYFPDLLRHASGCAYYNCTHTHEPSCAVKEAVAQGLIAPSRYESYLKLLEDDKKYRK